MQFFLIIINIYFFAKHDEKTQIEISKYIVSA